MAITITIVARGIASGIERTCRILRPLLLVLILVMVIYGASTEGFAAALDFIFRPDVHKLRPSGVLEALGHAFFTLSLGMGAMITYGSYQTSKRGLAGQSITIAGLDTGIALLACLMIFPIIMTYDQEPAAGPGLVFESMPLAFAELGRTGMLLGIIFFGLVAVAALTSSISLLEVVASYFIDSLGWSRARAAWLLGGAILLFGLPTAFSYDPGFKMQGWAESYPAPFFDTLDYMATNWMLPLGGLLIAIYAGWVMPARLRNAELAGLSPALTTGWLLLVRFVAPALVIIVLIQKVGILDADELLHGMFN
jgi:NSS family neurotransmitter:Na+ symporter